MICATKSGGCCMVFKKNLILNLILKAKRLNPYNYHGQIVVIMLIIAMIIGIVIPGLIYLTQHEAKWTVKEIKSTRAFHLAEAGLDRGVFALNGISNGWNDAKNGIIPSGYTGITEYTDISGGIYKIKISSGPNTNEVTIAAIGKDASTSETRGIKTVYSRDMAQSAIECSNDMKLQGNFCVHWGPVKTLQTMQLSGAGANRYHPRKYARGDIEGRTPPNSDRCEYWAYTEITDLAEVNLSSYVAKAKAYTPNVENGTTNPPIGSAGWEGGYYPGDVTFNTNFRDWPSGLTVNDFAGAGGTPTYYIAGDVTIKPNTFIKGNLIAEDDIDFQGAGWANNYTVKVPKNARKEYYHADGAGSCGKALHASARDVWDDAGWINDTNTQLSDLKFHGFIYAGEDITGATSNQGIVGVVICQGCVDKLGGTAGVYFDEDVADSIEYSSQKFARVSWLEFVPGSFTSPNW